MSQPFPSAQFASYATPAAKVTKRRPRKTPAQNTKRRHRTTPAQEALRQQQLERLEDLVRDEYDPVRMWKTLQDNRPAHLKYDQKKWDLECQKHVDNALFRCRDIPDYLVVNPLLPLSESLPQFLLPQPHYAPRVVQPPVFIDLTGDDESQDATTSTSSHTVRQQTPTTISSVDEAKEEFVSRGLGRPAREDGWDGDMDKYSRRTDASIARDNEDHIARQLFGQRFRHGYGLVPNQADNLECGFHALRDSLREQTQDLPVPDVLYLRYMWEYDPEIATEVAAFEGEDGGRNNTNNLHVDQVGLLLRMWGRRHGRSLRLGVVMGDGRVWLVSHPDPHATIIWVRSSASVVDDYTIEHWEGIRSHMCSVPYSTHHYDGVRMPIPSYRGWGY